MLLLLILLSFSPPPYAANISRHYACHRCFTITLRRHYAITPRSPPSSLLVIHTRHPSHAWLSLAITPSITPRHSLPYASFSIAIGTSFVIVVIVTLLPGIREFPHWIAILVSPGITPRCHGHYTLPRRRLRQFVTSPAGRRFTSLFLPPHWSGISFGAG